MLKPSLLIASNNPGKLREASAILASLPLRIITPGELGLDLDVPETGSTYAENARIKARAFAGRSGLLALADDSGLEVFALGGWPGLHSARFAGSGASDQARYTELLRRLAGVPDGQRGARFVCHVALSDPNAIIAEGVGILDGRIARSPSGTGGFGFDPIFIPDGYTCTIAELPIEIKNVISHRARAIASIRPFLRRLVEDPSSASATNPSSP